MQQVAGHCKAGIAAGIDERSHGLGLGQIQFAVDEGPTGEFAAFGQAGQSGLADGVKDGCRYQRVAVTTDLHQVFAGMGPGGRMQNCHDVINGMAVRVTDHGVGLQVGLPGVSGRQLFEDCGGIFAADADYTDPPAAAGGRFCINSFCQDLEAFRGTITTFFKAPSPTLLVLTELSSLSVRCIMRRSCGFILSRLTE